MQLHNFVIPMTVGIGAGILTRVLLTETSYRQLPSKPHGMVIHMFLGFVASLLGALIIPAIIKPDFTAGVFVSIGTAQFHTMRKLEREAWTELDKGELVPRGAALIEGIAVAFEARIFLVIAVAGLTTLLSYGLHWPLGAVCGVVLAIVIKLWKQGKSVSDVAYVHVGEVRIDGREVFVDGNSVCTLSQEGSPPTVSDIVAVVVEPKNASGLLSFGHKGQQQAMLHNLAATVGVQEHADIKPLALYDPKRRKLILVLTALLPDITTAVATVSGAPMLESIYRHSIIRWNRAR